LHHHHQNHSPLITLSPQGENLYILPRNANKDAAAVTEAQKIAGDIVVLGRNPDTGGVRALQDLAT
jgi:hypothetical protein